MNTIENWLINRLNIRQEIVLASLFTFSGLAAFIGLGKLVDYPFNWDFIVDIGPSNIDTIAKNSFWEEVLFRFLPGLLLFKFLKEKKLAIVLFVLTAPIFAYLHFGFISVIALTPFSLSMTIAYMKFGGASDNHARGLLFAGLIHTAFNITIHTYATFSYIFH